MATATFRSHWWLGTLVGLGLLLAACGGDDPTDVTGEQTDDTTEPPALSGELSDETLAELADAAWLAAGFTGDPTLVDAGNGRTVGKGSVTVVDGGLDAAVLAAGLPDELDYGAAGGLTMPSAATAIANGVSHSLDSALALVASADFDLTGTYACAAGGTVTITGSLAVSAQQKFAEDGITVTNGSVRTQITDLVVEFAGCETTTHRMWGTVLVSTDNLLSAHQMVATPDIYDIAFDVDEYVQAGLAYEDVLAPGTYYRILLRYNRTGAIDATRDTTATPGDLNEFVLVGTLSALTTSNGVQCETTVTYDGGDETTAVVDRPACTGP